VTSPANTSSTTGPGTSGVRPWPRRSTVCTRNRSVSPARIGPKSRESLKPPCSRTSGSPSPRTSCQVRNPFTIEYIPATTREGGQTHRQTEQCEELVSQERGGRRRVPLEQTVVDRAQRLRPRSAMVSRARCNALFTAATVLSSSPATSAARQDSTARRISTARCRGGRCCNAATNASRTVSRPSARTSAGSTRSSGTGRTHADAGSGSPSGVPSAEGEVRSIATARRCALRSMSTHTFVAIAYNQVFSEPVPGRNRRARPARTPPARRPRLRTAHRACGSSSRSSRRGALQGPRRCQPLVVARAACSASSILPLVTMVMPASRASVNSAMTANTARSPRSCPSMPPMAAPSGMVPQATSR
jgi:hypothetical protein